LQRGEERAVLEWQHDIPTRYFATYEDLEEAFRRRVGGLVPRYHAGTRVFWDDFQHLYEHPHPGGRETCEAYITSNPRDCLAFGTPFQVLQGARLAAVKRSAEPPATPERTAERFGLSEHLHQPIRTLSGGETVRLALAKAYLLAACAARLTVASPFSWLALEHWEDFRFVADHYRTCRTNRELLALEGEDSLMPAAADPHPEPAPVQFAWRLKDLRLDLGSLMDHLHDRPVRAAVAPVDESLSSPCLFQGDNGQGKSLIAKALAAAIPFQGEAVVCGPDGPLRARLVFQDVLNQTLMRSRRQLIPREKADDTASAYDDILAGLRRRLSVPLGAMPFWAQRGRDAAPLRLLEIKMLLAALRLAEPRAALILDEPDWRLSRSQAIAFVAAVVHAAHDRGIPVILISHKPWWRTMARSVRTFRKEALPDGGSLFRIRIAAAPAGAA